MNANLDLIGVDGKVTGELANYMSANGRMDPNRMRPFLGRDGKPYFSVYKGGPVDNKENWTTVPAPLNVNATLQRDEWKALDDAVVRAADYRLGGVDDLISKGLVYNLGNAMGTTVLEWHDVAGDLTATMTMDAITRTQNNRPDWNYNYIPIPIVHVDYEINSRELSVSRNMGNPLDTTMAERAARAVNEYLENMLFTNVTYSYGETDSRSRNTIYSYVNHPDRHQISLGTAWTSATGKAIVDQVLTWKQHSIDARHYGPWMLYIPSAYETVIDEDYVGSTPDTAPNTTIRQRIMMIAGIQGIKVIDTLAANNVLMVQMTSDVVRLIRGLAPQNIQWGEEGNFVTKFKVLTIQVPQIRSDPAGRSGVLHIA